MIRKVLIVDDNPELLLSLQDGLEKYHTTFSVLTSSDGKAAVAVLEKNLISLVVTDLKMPRMDGFALLSHVMEHYPDIPVIVITAYGTPKIEKYARKSGAVAYIEKPFMIEDLSRKIITMLRNESDGGTLHDVSSGTFLQLIEMEEKTCTIRIKDSATDKQGVLFFKSGQLMEARINELRGIAAAHEIFSWNNTRISIQNSCVLTGKRIKNNNIQSLLLESMHQKDETRQKQRQKPPPAAKMPVVNRQTVLTGPDGVPDPITENDIETLQRRLKKELGSDLGSISIRADSSWDNFISFCESIGKGLNAGKLKVGYIERDASKDTAFLPGSPATVISVNTRCPKDRIIRILNN